MPLYVHFAIVGCASLRLIWRPRGEVQAVKLRIGIAMCQEHGCAKELSRGRRWSGPPREEAVMPTMSQDGSSRTVNTKSVDDEGQ